MHTLLSRVPRRRVLTVMAGGVAGWPILIAAAKVPSLN
jgi:hypothetical protein